MRQILVTLCDKCNNAINNDGIVIDGSIYNASGYESNNRDAPIITSSYDIHTERAYHVKCLMELLNDAGIEVTRWA